MPGPYLANLHFVIRNKEFPFIEKVLFFKGEEKREGRKEKERNKEGEREKDKKERTKGRERGKEGKEGIFCIFSGSGMWMFRIPHLGPLWYLPINKKCDLSSPHHCFQSPAITVSE